MRLRHSPEPPYSRGESDDPRLGDVIKQVTLPEFARKQWDWAIIGLPDDRGVALNGGRPGAAEGPAAIRRWLQRLVPPRELSIADLGDLEMSDNLNADHSAAASAISLALNSADRVAILGGGHDWGFSPIAALLQAGRVGFVNFDAHLDVRASKVHHSGTSYWRALNAGVKGSDAAWFGVQASASAQSHIDFVAAHGGKVFFADYPAEDPDDARSALSPLALPDFDYLDVSLDMDVFSMAEAPGVSAPQPMGLTAVEVIAMLSNVLRRREVRTFGIYETAPPLDLPGEPTARLAARCLWEALAGEVVAEGEYD